jgi:hypothetical protein
MMTVHSQLVASENDLMGYITYVFKSLEADVPFGSRYLMLTRCPNWDAEPINIGDKGYVTYDYVEAGKDKWYCPETGQMIPYNYTNIYFKKFVKEVDNYKKDIII